MGGFASILGSAAGGYQKAAQIDKQRAFENEMESRRQAGEFLQKIALDETATPEARNAAATEFGNLHATPHTKQYKLDLHKTGIINPGRPAQSVTTPGLQMPAMPPGGAQPSFTPTSQALPPGVAGPPEVGEGAPQMSMPAPPPGLMNAATQGVGAGTVSTPAIPPSIFKSPQQQSQEAAGMVGATTGAQMRAQMQERQRMLEGVEGLSPEEKAAFSIGIPGVASMIGAYGQGDKIPASQAIAQGIPLPDGVDPNTGWVQIKRNKLNHIVGVNGTIAPRSGLQKVTYVDPETKQPRFGTQNLATNEIFDQGGKIVPDAVPFESSLVTKESSTTTPGGMTTKKITGPVGTGGTRGGGKGGGTSAGGGSAATETRPDVLAAKDSLKMYGLPSGKMSDAQSIALQQVKKEGWDPVPAASAAAKSRADAARSIYPLLQKARDLIAANPGALGPIPGRWSEFQKKIGSLSGPPRELANTLKSIYSIAGTMHGWRAIKVADEFEHSFGGLKDSPAAIIDGLNAMEGTAHAVESVGYPGLSQPAAPPSGAAGMVMMKAPNGVTKPVPADQVEHYKSKGATVVQ